MTRIWLLRIARGAVASLLLGAVLGGLEAAVLLRGVIGVQLVASERLLLWALAAGTYGLLGAILGAALAASLGALFGQDAASVSLRLDTGRDPAHAWLPWVQGAVALVVGLILLAPVALEVPPAERIRGMALLLLPIVVAAAFAVSTRLLFAKVDHTGRGMGLVLLGLPAALLITMSLAVSAPMAGGRGEANRARQGLPDVLLITVDGLRADHVGLGARVNTPNLNSLARQGLSFSQVTVPSTAELPPVVSLLTGAHPLTSGVATDRGRLPRRTPGKGRELRTLAEALRSEGYATGAFVASRGLAGRATGLRRGFDVYDDGIGEQISGASALAIRRLWSLLGSGAQARPGPSVLRTSAETVLRYRRWLQWHSRENTFAWLHLADPRIPWLGTPDLSASLADPIPGKAGRAYGERVAQLDDLIGELMRALEADGTLDSTLVVLAGTRGLVPGGGRPSVADPWTQVPLIFVGPTLDGDSRRVDRQVRLQDVAPSLLTAVGIRKARMLDGVALVGPMGSAGGADELQAVALAPPRRDGKTAVAIRAGRWKYVREPRGGASLYDLQKDPDELDDASPANPQIAASIAAGLDSMLGRDVPTLAVPEVGPERRAILRALDANR